MISLKQIDSKRFIIALFTIFLPDNSNIPSARENFSHAGKLICMKNFFTVLLFKKVKFESDLLKTSLMAFSLTQLL